MANGFDGFGLEPTDGVTNATPVEVSANLPITDAHDVSQSTMLLGKILEFVVIQVATEAHGGQYGDLPVAEPFSSTKGAIRSLP